MKEEIYNVGDKVRFERGDGSTVAIALIKKVYRKKQCYTVDWYDEKGITRDNDDSFTFIDVGRIQRGQRPDWKITHVERQTHLPEELFTL